MHRAVSPRSATPVARRVGLLLVAVVAAACSDSATAQESAYAQRCAHPRTGIDPATRQAYSDVAGSVMDEKLWIHWSIHDLYLWYREVPDASFLKIPAALAKAPTAIDYFDQERTPAPGSTPAPRCRRSGCRACSC